MADVKSLAIAAKNKLQRDGLKASFAKAREMALGRKYENQFAKNNPDSISFVDVLFINGCDYSVPHPIRYRVDHQIQQLAANGFYVERVDAWDFDIDACLARARVFVIFRCPHADFLEEFVKRAKRMNKLVFFDIDDLVIDRKYTDLIPYLDTMSPEERAGYDDGVDRMGRMLKVCGNAITSTDCLGEELSTLIDGTVYVNRNVASQEMVYFSNRANYERDELPYLPPDKVSDDEKTHYEWSKRRLQARVATGEVVLGYFSGSITHNDDFALVVPALIRVLEQRPQAKLMVVGELDLPDALQPYADRVKAVPFSPWQKLPEMISQADINLVPLQDTIFNRAKSENKWVEASLVKVPTVASKVGPFADFIEHGVTGYLCETEQDWEATLLAAIDDAEGRKNVADAAYAFCRENCTTLAPSGSRFARFIRETQAPNVMMMLPSTEISGGIIVALRHCCILQDAGFDVTLVEDSLNYSGHTLEMFGHTFPVVHARSEQNRDMKVLFKGRVDCAVATMWTTLNLFDTYGRIGKKKYLVQNFETDFYQEPDQNKLWANATYSRWDVDYLTISKWCQNWLEERFCTQSRFAANGIDLQAFYPTVREFPEGERVRILVEGDSKSYYKNVDEAFAIIELLDPAQYEVWYMSYNGEPKPFYRVDKFLHAVPPEQVADVYRQCHILLKTSILESFSYPPLEMMATGGFVVACPNGGNVEYLVDGQNCLLYEQGNLEQGAAKIQALVDDPELRQRLLEGGRACAEQRSWEALEQDILSLYD
ncbi:MAG: glycosyltransferase [Coriobacteriia bacterium]|nr:glycosyltransferase [Coriobacteriia bacterium]